MMAELMNKRTMTRTVDGNVPMNELYY